MYLLLHRAIKNAGDYLIFQRAQALLRAERPTAEFRVAKSWIPLAEQMQRAELTSLQAIVICGGPGYQHDMYPAVYPLGPLEDLPPIIPLALGSFIYPGTEQQVQRFRFNGATVRLLDGVVNRPGHLGARDELTARLLSAAGYADVLMTGDPAWYDLEMIDGSPDSPQVIRSIAFTPPANPTFFHQGRELLLGLIKRVGVANVVVVFHREWQLPFADIARRLGVAATDISGGSHGFRVYDQTDLHVGYRVHAHLYCLSRGRISYLVAEDSRGLGALHTLGMLGAAANVTSGADSLRRMVWRVLPRVASARRRSTSWLGPAASRLIRVPAVTDVILRQLAEDESAGFARHESARGVIRATLPTMRAMIAEIP